MRVKRYVVDTMPEAMLQIRNDLGSDAVILSTKETKLGGFLGMFKKKKSRSSPRWKQTNRRIQQRNSGRPRLLKRRPSHRRPCRRHTRRPPS